MKLKFFCLFLFITNSYFAYSQDKRSNFLGWLKENNCQLKGVFNQYDYERYNVVVHQDRFGVSPSGAGTTQYFQDSKWEISYKATPVSDRADAVEIEMLFKVIEGKTAQTAPVVELQFSDWDTANYVLMPSAAYNGNRFESRRIRYSPKLLDPKDIGATKPTIISDVPRLNIADGVSRIQDRAGAMSVPSIGFWAAKSKKSFWLLTDLATQYGDNGIGIEESRDRKTAKITITAPCVRELYKYRITDNQFPSDDRAPDFKAGDEVKIRFRIYFSEAPTLQSLFNRFAEIRKDLVGTTAAAKKTMPFSEAYQTVHDKFNKEVEKDGNWDEQFGYYTVGNRENFLQDWQIGWTGGMISTLPLLTDGSKTTQDRVLRVFDWLFPAGISPSGYFWDSGEKGNLWYGGDIRKPTSTNWHLTRKGGDGLYYVLKQFMAMESRKITVKDTWKTSAKGVADAFVKTWNNDGQFGNFIDSQTGKVAVGGSASGGIVPAALALAYKYYGDEAYLKTAEESAAYYYTYFVKKGITNGGPGDALQNPDSESCYALLESFTILYDITQNKQYLTMAEDIAMQFTTWVMAYNYPFPASSTFGKLGMTSIGAVGANTQNKHGAPGICTHSGIGLLRLYRATGNKHYLTLLQEIAACIPQFISHPQKPIGDLPFGWMSERVSTTDWLEGIGEIVRHTTWAETALMLTYTEIPGLYVQPDQSFFVAIDHVNVAVKKDDKTKLTLLISNPTSFTAKLKVLAENTKQKSQAIPFNPVYEIVVIPAGASVEKSFVKK
jgi:hypothetical protein